MVREHRHSTVSLWELVTVLPGWDGVHTDILSIIRVTEERIGQAWMRLIKESFLEQVTYRDGVQEETLCWLRVPQRAQVYTGLPRTDNGLSSEAE